MEDLQRLIREASGPNPRLALAAVRALEDELEWLLVRAVRLARDQGYDWGRIGRLLAISRQAARKRFDRLAPVVGPTPHHRRGLTDWHLHAAAVDESVADARRRREFEFGDPVFW